jgi:general secretion pathway protein J
VKDQYTDKQTGLTLIELLVTMVLLSFVVILMSGAFVQIAQMLRISSDHGNGFTGRWVQSRVLQDIVANMIIDPVESEPFIGTDSRSRLTTLAIPPNQSGIGETATLELIRSPYSTAEDGTTRLEIIVQAKNDSRNLTRTFELGVFKGRLLFVYFDAQGNEFQQWPPSNFEKKDTLPSALGIRDQDQKGKILQIANFQGEVTNKPSGNLGTLFGQKR